MSIYKIGKTWFFDDKDRNIFREAFVLGASELIQSMLDSKNIKKRKNIIVIFSTQRIPDYDILLTCTEKLYPLVITDWKQSAIGKKPTYTVNENVLPTSAWYVDEQGNKCWLCPAQLAFFDAVADQIYIKF